VSISPFSRIAYEKDMKKKHEKETPPGHEVPGGFELHATTRSFDLSRMNAAACGRSVMGSYETMKVA